MPPNKPSSASNLYQIFVRRPGDAVGLVAFGIYQLEEIQFIDHELANLEDAEGDGPRIDAFRSVAISFIEIYRRHAREILKDYFEGRDTGPSRMEVLETVKAVRAMARDGELDGAIRQVFALLDSMAGQSSRRLDFGVIAANFAIVKKKDAKGLSTMEETRIGFARATDSILAFLDELTVED